MKSVLPVNVSPHPVKCHHLVKSAHPVESVAQVKSLVHQVRLLVPPVLVKLQVLVKSVPQAKLPAHQAKSLVPRVKSVPRVKLHLRVSALVQLVKSTVHQVRLSAHQVRLSVHLALLVKLLALQPNVLVHQVKLSVLQAKLPALQLNASAHQAKLYHLVKLPVVPVKWYRLAKLASQVKKYLPVNKYHQVNLLVHVVNLLAKVQNIHHYQVSPAQVKTSTVSETSLETVTCKHHGCSKTKTHHSTPTKCVTKQ